MEFAGAEYIKNWILYAFRTCEFHSGGINVPLLVQQEYKRNRGDYGAKWFWGQKRWAYVIDTKFEGAYDIKNWILYVVRTCEFPSGEANMPLLVQNVYKHGIAATIKMEECAARRSAWNADEGRTTDRPLLLFGDLFPPGAGPRPAGRRILLYLNSNL
jgi:hypothetical protein